MKKQYKVFSVNNQPTTVTAILPGGAEVNAIVEGLEIQLVPVESASGTIKLNYTNPEDIAAARGTFTEGKSVVIDFAPV